MELCISVCTVEKIVRKCVYPEVKWMEVCFSRSVLAAFPSIAPSHRWRADRTRARYNEQPASVFPLPAPSYTCAQTPGSSSTLSLWISWIKAFALLCLVERHPCALEAWSSAKLRRVRASYPARKLPAGARNTVMQWWNTEILLLLDLEAT